MARVLVVEDDPDLRFLYQTTLLHNGYEVVDAEDAHTAMAHLDLDTFDLVMLDLNMPDAHGTAVIDYLHSDDRHLNTPIIIITANDHWLDSVFERGVNNVLVKPVSMTEIIERVRRLLD